jgi:hypothetical protein
MRGIPDFVRLYPTKTIRKEINPSNEYGHTPTFCPSPNQRQLG